MEESTCSPYADRVETPEGGHICCGEVIPRGNGGDRPEYLREDLCRNLGWMPSREQKAIYDFWDGNLLHERADPPRFGLDITEDEVRCLKDDSLPFKISLLGDETFFCNERVAIENYDTRNIYTGSYGALKEAEIFLSNDCSNDGSCKRPFTELLEKPPWYEPRDSIQGEGSRNNIGSTNNENPLNMNEDCGDGPWYYRISPMCAHHRGK